MAEATEIKVAPLFCVYCGTDITRSESDDKAMVTFRCASPACKAEFLVSGNNPVLGLAGEQAVLVHKVATGIVYELVSRQYAATPAKIAAITPAAVPATQKPVEGNTAENDVKPQKVLEDMLRFGAVVFAAGDGADSVPKRFARVCRLFAYILLRILLSRQLVVSLLVGLFYLVPLYLTFTIAWKAIGKSLLDWTEPQN